MPTVTTQSSQENRKRILSKCFYDDVIGTTSFFDNFYRENGSGYFFLFKKNLSITNIQFAELVALLKNHSSCGNEKDIGSKFQFFTAPQFNDTVRELIDSYALEKLNKVEEEFRREVESAALHFADKYCSLLEHVVAIDPYYTSCSVYLPPHIVIDLEKICGLSGYIYSCGLHIYVRNIEKSKHQVLINSIGSYLKKNPPKKDKKIFFTVYAHEDFSAYDLDSKDDTKNGRHGVKIHEEKYFMGQTSLVKLIEALKKDYPNEIFIPERGSYKDHKYLFENEPLERHRSIWLIMDKKIDLRAIQYPDDSSYYICYEHRYTNSNQLHLFDENKIAWKSNTTLPHTLCSAMLNIALSNVEGNVVTICDPFLGSGTTFFESLKYDNLRFYGSDLDSFSRVLTKYNREFFTFSEAILRELGGELETLTKESGGRVTKLKTRIEEINRILGSPKNGEFEFNEQQILAIDKLGFKQKSLFFIVLRIKIKYLNKFVRAAKEDIESHLANEISAFSRQLKKYQRLCDLAKLEDILKDTNNENALVKWQGLYSENLSINMAKFNDCNLNRVRTGPEANVKFLEENKYDIIVTDPPYGFNTNDKVLELADLYNDFLERLICSLKDNGQLVICLPEKSFSGKTSPFFTHKEIVFQRILSVCNKKGYEMVTPIYMVPNRELFKPPYYWNAEKALSRSIIHIRIRHPRPPKPEPEKMAVFLIGPSGAGKSTLAEYLKSEYELKCISGGNILRNLATGNDHEAEMARKVITRGGAANDDLIMKHYALHIKTQRNGVVFDGNPSGENQARKTLELLNQYKRIYIIKLICSRNTSLDRARDNKQERDDKKTKNIENRLEWFYSDVQIAYEYLKDRVSGIVEIDAEESIEVVRDKAISFLEQHIKKEVDHGPSKYNKGE